MSNSNLPTPEDVLQAYITTGFEPVSHKLISFDGQGACGVGAVVCARTGYRPLFPVPDTGPRIPFCVIEDAGLLETDWGAYGQGFDDCLDGEPRREEEFMSGKYKAVYEQGYEAAEYVLKELPKRRAALREDVDYKEVF